jgi:hypothetical protein
MESACALRHCRRRGRVSPRTSCFGELLGLAERRAGQANSSVQLRYERNRARFACRELGYRIAPGLFCVCFRVCDDQAGLYEGAMRLLLP